MRKTGLLGILLVCSLSTAIPVRAAEIPAHPVTEVTLESEAASNAGSTEEETVSSEVVSETEADAASQEAASEVQVPKEDGAGLSADSAADPALVDGPGQKDSTAPVEDTEQKSDAAPVEDTELKNDADLIENTELKDNTAPVESTDQKDNSALSEDIPITEESAAEAAGVTISAEPVPASDEQAPLAAAAENAVFSVSEKAAANLAEEMTKDRIHFITLNGVYSASDAILIESKGKYGLIDSSNPSSASSDPNLAFTREYLDAAANGQTVVKYLTDLDISHLEFVLATHSHSDHIGGMPDIANSGLVNSETVYIYKDYSAITGQEDFHNDYYANLAVKAMRDKGAKLLNVLTQKDNEPYKFYLGNFLIKLFNLGETSNVNENLNSIVTTVQKNSSGAGAILMGDMEMDKYMESRTVDAIIRNDVTFRADVYKAGHHGYSTSNSPDTINALKPVNCVVSTNRLSMAVDSQTYYNYFVEINGGKVFRTSENGPAIIAEFGDQGVSMLRPVSMNTTTAAVPWNAVISDGWKPWYPDEDSFNRTGLKWIYFQSGSPLKGWFKAGLKWYLADDNYNLVTGWTSYKDEWYFLSDSGAMQTGWVSSGGKWYYLDSKGVMQTGWVSSGGKWYLMGSDGTMLTGRQMFDGNTYFFNDAGVMQTGWYKYGDNWFFLRSSGAMQIGWVSSGGKWYYLASDGTMLKGRQVVDGKTYFFNDAGVMQTSWVSSGGKWYFFDSKGAMQTGRITIGGKWYLLGSDGAMLTGWQTYNSNVYFFSDSGAMQTGWVSSGGKWYYLDGTGVMQTGWITINGKWYLLGSDGVMLKGWQAYNGNIYFFSGGGAMQTGWASSNGRWYYLSSSGILQTGWITINGKWYLLGSDGSMLTGRQTVDGKTYFFGSGGTMQTGWIKYNGKWYYLESNGVMAADKWIGDYYVKSDGTMAINEWIGPYYVGADGKWIKGYKATA
ncbi:MAG: MBL fold metallo-hydrolase [Lachnospiraceae bacterium]|nr:MBL fold metallo-hydrolase [Lachnospiraceae bacterium]